MVSLLLEGMHTFVVPGATVAMKVVCLAVPRKVWIRMRKQWKVLPHTCHFRIDFVVANDMSNTAFTRGL